MRKFLNTLFVLNPDAYLMLENETLVVKVDKQKLGQFPLLNLEAISCFNFAGASPAIIGECVSRGINVCFFSPFGRFLYRAEGAKRGNVLLRERQFLASQDKDLSLAIAKNMIIGKLYNERSVVERGLRDYCDRIDKEKFEHVSEELLSFRNSIDDVTDMDELRGIEGKSANLYFQVFDDLILCNKSSFYFTNRNRRPPMDSVNAMLSFGYSLLAGDCMGALENVGLDSFVGFMHVLRSGRKSLALDLMEELRSPLVDRFVLSLINNKQISPKHFEKSELGACSFTEEGKRLFISAWQNRKKEIITHPYLGEKMEWGLIPYAQALLLARFLRGDIDGYPCFFWR